MSILRIEATNELPEIFLDSYNSILNFSGVARPENVFDLYTQISSWIDDYNVNFGEEIKCKFNFKYLNTSSRKMVFEILKKLINISKTQNKKLSVCWMYNAKDEDMIELGEEFQELLGVTFSFVVK